MITKEKARALAEQYLKDKKRDYVSIAAADKIVYRENKKILHGDKEGETDNVYLVHYSSLWGAEERGVVVYVSAGTGEILYSLSSHGWVEETEE